MTTIIADEVDKHINERPGAQLAAVRTAKGYTVEYIAAKLHLRVRVIELLEADDYSKMPNSVFIKGYLRAYAKLVEMNADALLETFNRNFSVERKTDKAALWQSKRDTSGGERAIRWLTTLFGLVVLCAVAIWWQKSKENQNLFATTTAASQPLDNTEHAQVDIRLTDLSKMRSLLSPESQYSSLDDNDSLETTSNLENNGD